MRIGIIRRRLLCKLWARRRSAICQVCLGAGRADETVPLLVRAVDLAKWGHTYARGFSQNVYYTLVYFKVFNVSSIPLTRYIDSLLHKHIWVRLTFDYLAGANLAMQLESYGLRYYPS